MTQGSRLLLSRDLVVISTRYRVATFGGLEASLWRLYKPGLGVAQITSTHIPLVEVRLKDISDCKGGWEDSLAGCSGGEVMRGHPLICVRGLVLTHKVSPIAVKSNET